MKKTSLLIVILGFCGMGISGYLTYGYLVDISNRLITQNRGFRAVLFLFP
jgi:predicted ATP-grasp superfamily ATP-dependent carboligase